MLSPPWRTKHLLFLCSMGIDRQQALRDLVFRLLNLAQGCTIMMMEPLFRGRKGLILAAGTDADRMRIFGEAGMSEFQQRTKRVTLHS